MEFLLKVWSGAVNCLHVVTVEKCEGMYLSFGVSSGLDRTWWPVAPSFTAEQKVGE